MHRLPQRWLSWYNCDFLEIMIIRSSFRTRVRRCDGDNTHKHDKLNWLFDTEFDGISTMSCSRLCPRRRYIYVGLIQDLFNQPLHWHDIACVTMQWTSTFQYACIHNVHKILKALLATRTRMHSDDDNSDYVRHMAHGSLTHKVRTCSPGLDASAVCLPRMFWWMTNHHGELHTTTKPASALSHLRSTLPCLSHKCRPCMPPNSYGSMPSKYTQDPSILLLKADSALHSSCRTSPFRLYTPHRLHTCIHFAKCAQCLHLIIVHECESVEK